MKLGMEIVLFFGVLTQILKYLHRQKAKVSHTYRCGTPLPCVYMFLLYCPPASYNECVIWPRLQYFTVSINSAKRFPLDIATSWSLFKASALFDSFRFQKARRFWICCSFSSDVLRITSPGKMVGLPFLFKKVFCLIMNIRKYLGPTMSVLN